MESYDSLKDKYDKLLASHNDLQIRFNNVYKANQQKKDENFKLRGQVASLKKRCCDLTFLVDVAIRERRNKWREK